MSRISRRSLHGWALSSAAAWSAGIPRVHGWGLGSSSTPLITHGVMAGEVTDGSAVIWSRCDQPARMMVEVQIEGKDRPMLFTGPQVTAETDFTGKVVIDGLRHGEGDYRVWFVGPDGKPGDSVPGQLIGVENEKGDVMFAWSGDTVGQGFGINSEWGGLKIYDAIRRLKPDFFVHCGDMIYADNPIPSEIKLADGTIWKNLTTQAKDHVAVTLDDFRGNYAYNLLDENLRRFHAAVPQYVLWDDHETTNNWYPQQQLASRKDRQFYEEVQFGHQLAARSREAFFNYTPLSYSQQNQQRIYRKISRGNKLDLFLLDLRSYRGPNSPNLQKESSSAAAILGATQLAWLKKQLQASTALWKIICCDMPLGLVIPDAMEGAAWQEGVSNAEHGPPLGREHEFAELLRFIKTAGVKNIIWLTADVHYAAAHYYDPSRSALPGQFEPFWEFVAGPLHAGTFGPNELDGTFGPEVKFQWAPDKALPRPVPPSAGMQSFGTIKMNGRSGGLTVTLRDLTGKGIPGGEFELTPE
ncbi:MAG: alkaline phosphatase D family protein [Pirellulales bacterium]|nr:alkaline phosphatase D family protein [Pirellulales bacterium]